MYLDTSLGGWMGWKENVKDLVATIPDLGVSSHLRGFATNVAGYQAVGKMRPSYDWWLNIAHPDDECCYRPCGLTTQWNPSRNEHYSLHLRKALSKGIPGVEPQIIFTVARP